MTWYNDNNSGQPLSPAQYDREILMLCDPSGAKVLVQDVTSVEAPLGTAPTLLAWNLNGTPYAGAISDLKNCNDGGINIQKEDYCLNGENINKVTGINEIDGTILWTLWLDSNNAVIQSPTQPTHSTVGGWTGGVGQPLSVLNSSVLVKGVCSLELNKNKKLYLSENTSILTLSSIITLLPANSIIESVSVTQVIGTGSITGDIGSGLVMETGRTDSFNVEDFGNLNTSSMSMNAGVGGIQRISIIYSN